MGAEVADRTLFVGNLHPKATEELLFELFLQAGPAVNVKIPKDKDGKPKQFAFVNFKHEESVPYGMNLLNGIKLFGRPLKIQYRSGSTHISQDTSATQSPQGGNASAGNGQPSNGSRQDHNEDFIKYSENSPVSNYQRSYSSPDNLQRQAVMNNFYKQESPHGSRSSPMGQQPSPPLSTYTPNNSWYSPNSNQPPPHRYDSPPGHRSPRHLASHPYKNEHYYNRDSYSRGGQEDRHNRSHGQEEHHYRSHGQEEHHYRSHGQEEHHYRSHSQEEHHYRSRAPERLSPNPRKDPRWGPPHH